MELKVESFLLFFYVFSVKRLVISTKVFIFVTESGTNSPFFPHLLFVISNLNYNGRQKRNTLRC